MAFAPIFDESLFWPAFKAAGMLRAARIVLPGDTVETPIDVKFTRNEFEPVSGIRSRNPEIRYQYADAPDLREGHEIIIDTITNGEIRYKLREHPYVDRDSGGTGFFRTASLSQLEPDCDV